MCPGPCTGAFIPTPVFRHIPKSCFMLRWQSLQRTFTYARLSTFIIPCACTDAHLLNNVACTLIACTCCLGIGCVGLEAPAVASPGTLTTNTAGSTIAVASIVPAPPDPAVQCSSLTALCGITRTLAWPLEHNCSPKALLSCTAADHLPRVAPSSLQSFSLVPAWPRDAPWVTKGHFLTPLQGQ